MSGEINFIRLIVNFIFSYCPIEKMYLNLKMNK